MNQVHHSLNFQSYFKNSLLKTIFNVLMHAKGLMNYKCQCAKLINIENESTTF